MSTAPVKKTRHRTMSMEQRLVCEFFEAHPNSTRPQCKAKLGSDQKAVSRKVDALVASGHLVATSEGKTPTFSWTGKEFPHSDGYKANQKWLAAKMRADERASGRAIALDLVAASMHAMVMTGRAAA
ncbi:hypothetical protein SAMN04487926_12140 [Paraburkholderia steynii]|uniref:MarR family transcriptional regulator n=1 Tax=Paraburkholderia steynii TaxID=1245441 RepID=A0A7Z7BCZ6_9BURK|nr:hypothetical protein [Paraburkholderia steynii]SDI64982.1 hypothetical protein SAMN04487926_12140 [Paraburkholderia steynii]